VRIPEETMEDCLDDVTRALLPWADDTKNQFSLKIRIVFERMAKKFTIERLVLNGAIQEDHKILTYIRKQQAYKRRRFLKKRGIVPDDEVPGGPARANGKRGVTFKKGSQKESGSEDDSNSDSEADADMDDSWESRQRKRRLDGSTMNAGTGKSVGGKAKKDGRMKQPGLLDSARFVEDMEGGDGDAVDLLDTSALGRLMIGDKPKRSAGRGAGNKRALASDAFPVAEDGRLIIGTEEERKRSAIGEGLTEDSDGEDEGNQGRKKRPRHGASAPGVAGDTGASFRSRKAKGDVKRKGAKHEPYAYVPLDARMLNKRKKREAGRQFSGVVRGKGQGPAKGQKAKRSEDGVRKRR
jgi:ribosomal RNA-processing protein 12